MSLISRYFAYRINRHPEKALEKTTRYLELEDRMPRLRRRDSYGFLRAKRDSLLARLKWPSARAAAEAAFDRYMAARGSRKVAASTGVEHALRPPTRTGSIITGGHSVGGLSSMSSMPPPPVMFPMVMPFGPSSCHPGAPGHGGFGGIGFTSPCSHDYAHWNAATGGLDGNPSTSW